MVAGCGSAAAWRLLRAQAPKLSLATVFALANGQQLLAINVHLLAFERGFAGRTLAMSEVTDKAAYREGLPVTGRVLHVPFFDPGSPSRSLEAIESHKNQANLGQILRVLRMRRRPVAEALDALVEERVVRRASIDGEYVYVLQGAS